MYVVQHLEGILEVEFLKYENMVDQADKFNSSWSKAWSGKNSGYIFKSYTHRSIKIENGHKIKQASSVKNTSPLLCNK